MVQKKIEECIIIHGIRLAEVEELKERYQ